MPAANSFLLPQPVLAKVFRAKFRSQLSRHNIYKEVPSSVWSADWVVDIRSVGDGHAAFRYVAPYIFRVAITNKRILSCQDGKVTFAFKNSDSTDGKMKVAALTAEDFLHRFLQHVLPSRFRKVTILKHLSLNRSRLRTPINHLCPKSEIPNSSGTHKTQFSFIPPAKSFIATIFPDQKPTIPAF